MKTSSSDGATARTPAPASGERFESAGKLGHRVVRRVVERHMQPFAKHLHVAHARQRGRDAAAPAWPAAITSTIRPWMM